MLHRVLNGVSRLPVRQPNASMLRLSGRAFSNESHDDFMPKRKQIASELTEVVKLIDGEVKKYPILLFMKGTAAKPQCGFSLKVVRILNAVGADFASINVLEYPAIREGVKAYSEWPTLPQLFVNGEFIGGCDIVDGMHQDGSLKKMLEEKNLLSEK
jgi:monothiol glutaredoxin